MTESRYHPRGNGQFLCPAGFPVPPGTEEWTLIPGPKGDKGDKGEKGISRLPVRLAWAIVCLFVIAFVVAGTSLLLAAHEVNASKAAQRQASQIVERKLCATLSQVAALKPPAGNPATNPARAYDQELHTTLDQLKGDLGCPSAKGGTP